MFIHTPTPEQFKFLKERATAHATVDFVNCDPLIIELLKKFNDHEGIAPVWSCQGHLEDDGGEISFYCIFGVNESGAEWLQRYHVRLFKTMVEQGTEKFKSPHRLRLALTHRIFPDRNFNEWYPAWVMTFDFSNIKEQNPFFDLMHETFSSMKGE